MMTLGIYTIEKTLFEGDVLEIIAKTATGEITILSEHAPIISRLLKAPLKIRDTKGEEKTFHIDGGFLEVQPESNVVVLVEAHV